MSWNKIYKIIMKLKLTPLHQATLFLGVYATIAFFLNINNDGVFNWSLIGHLLVTVGLSLVFYLINLLFGKKVILLNTVITSLILFLLIQPTTTGLTGLLPAILATLFAIGIKYYGEYKGAPIINPAVFGILLASVVTLIWQQKPIDATWWGASFSGLWSLGLILIWLFGGSRKWRKHWIIYTFLLAHLCLLLLRGMDLSFVEYVFTDATIYFLASIMLIEPKTSPVRPLEQGIYGVAAAVVFNILLAYDVPLTYVLFLAIMNVVFFFWRFRKMLWGKSTPLPQATN